MSDLLMSNESFIQPEASLPSKPLLLFLFTSNPVEGEELANQLCYFGYQTRVFSRDTELHKALRKNAPKALILLMKSGADAVTDLHVLAKGTQRQVNPIPMVIISQDDSLEVRLQAVRAGAAAFFVQPVDAGSLIGAVEELSNPDIHIPYRILIIGETVSEASYYAMQFERIGLETRIVTDLPNLMKPLMEFDPDLVLLEHLLPGCSGSEIAHVIHQIENFISLPIVHLAAEPTEDPKRNLLSQNGEYLMTKPVKPKYLVSVVTSQARRYRRLRNLMVNDGLTGLFNHTSIKDRLDNEFLRAVREKKPLSFAMVDLDYFKRINDQYGHNSGDRVLKSVARLFKQRLRRTDFIGRNGGDEFAVIMPNTTAEEAASVMDYLRENFSNLQHRTQEASFTLTFSCGVASFPEYLTAAQLSHAADKAMYQAKRRGRNRVIQANRPGD